MLELIHKILYTGIGFAALTEEKARDLVAELEKQGEVSSAEGKKLAQDLIDKARHQSQELRQTIAQEVDKVSRKFKWVTREEFDQLRQRVDQLAGRPEEQPAEESP